VVETVTEKGEGRSAEVDPQIRAHEQLSSANPLPPDQLGTRKSLSRVDPAQVLEAGGGKATIIIYRNLTLLVSRLRARVNGRADLRRFRDCRRMMELSKRLELD